MTWIIKAIFVISVITFGLGIYNKVRERQEMEKLRKDVEAALEKHKRPEATSSFPVNEHFS